MERLIGLVCTLLPMAWMAWDMRDPCGPQGKAWQQCRAPLVKVKERRHG